MNARDSFTRPAGLLTTLLLAVAWMLLLPPLVHAAVTTSGNVVSDNGGLFVGNTADGNMTVDGGSLAGAVVSYIGYSVDSAGEIMVIGAGSEFISTPLYVGWEGNGTLEILDGGSVSGLYYIGVFQGSTGIVTVDGNHSECSSAGILAIGGQGNGVLEISGGATVRNTHGSIGDNAVGSSGAVTVDGNGSSWINNGSLRLYSPVSSTLTIRNGGLVEVATDVLVFRVGNETTTRIGFDGGTLDARSVISDHADLHGTGTINTQGWLFDENLTIATPNDLPSQVVLDEYPDQVITVNLNWTGDGTFGAEKGAVTIAGGQEISSSSGYIGYADSSNGSVIVMGDGSRWTNNGYLKVGANGHGTLEIRSQGKVISDRTFIGENAGSTGSVVVDGNGSTWNNENDLYIGHDGNGALAINNGGTVTSLDNFSRSYIGYSSSSTGSATVDGDGSSWMTHDDMYIGFEGNGRLSISNGGIVSSNRGAGIGSQSSSTGLVEVKGIGSMWISPGTIVGYEGNGTLFISDGAIVSNSISAGIGILRDSTGLVSVCGAGSLWNTGGVLRVGDNGNGTLMITEGGLVTSGVSGYIGMDPGSTGYVTVEGTDTHSGSSSTWSNSGELYVGYLGTGTMKITDGGTVDNTTGNISRYPGSRGIVIVDGHGSRWKNAGSLYISYFNAGSGTLTISNGGHVMVGDYLSINSISTLEFSLSSTSDPFLDVNGSAELDGTLVVDVDSALELQPGDLFTIIEVGDTLTGQFTGLDENDVVGTFDGFDLRISYMGGDGNDVELFTVLLGDMNGDGNVTTDDVGPFLQALTNRTAYNLVYGALVNADFAGDMDHSGTFDLGDVSAFSALIASLAEGGAEAAPEPGGLALLALTACCVATTGRRRCLAV